MPRLNVMAVLLAGLLSVFLFACGSSDVAGNEDDNCGCPENTTCFNGRCVANVLPGDNDDTSETDEPEECLTGGSCKSCPSGRHGECPVNEFCDPLNLTCTPGADCSGGLGECSSNYDCDTDEFCCGGECVEVKGSEPQTGCTDNTECAPNEWCSEGGICKDGGTQEGDGDECTTNEDCPEEEFCASNNKCAVPDQTDPGDDDTGGNTGDDDESTELVEDDSWVTPEEYERGQCEYDSYLGAAQISLMNSSKQAISEVNFGAVPILNPKQEYVLICNSGSKPLNVTSLQFSLATSLEFQKAHEELPITLEPGVYTTIHLRYRPQDSSDDTGLMAFLSDDPSNQRMELDLRGSVKAQGLIVSQPRVLQFAGAQPGQQIRKIVAAKNIGTAETSIFATLLNTSTNITGEGKEHYEAVEVTWPDGSTTNGPWTVQPGGYINIAVVMSMPTEGGAPDAELVLDWSTDTGREQTTVTLTTGDNALCATPNAGVDQTVRPLDTVQLDGSESYDDNGIVTEYFWQFIESPENATRAVLTDPDTGNSIEGRWTTVSKPQFYAELAGTYEIMLNVKDQDGSCNPEAIYDTVVVIAVPDETIHIQLVWGRNGNDHDLHFIKPGGFHSRGQNSNVTDCHWTNCNTRHGTSTPCPARGCPGPADAPDWGVIGSRDDDPTLDIDDISGPGPENINYSLPELGDFMVTVENYSGDQSNMVTVRIWIFGVMRLNVSYGPPMQSQGFRSNCYWKVAWINVHSPTDIDVSPINEFGSSGAAICP